MAKRKISEEKQLEYIDKATSVYIYHKSSYEKFIDSVVVNNSMIRPDGQWDEDTLSELQTAGRPALTINKLLPYIMALMGISVQSQTTHKVIGVNKDSDAGVAAIATRLLLHYYNRNNFQDTKEFVRHDGIIGKVGIYRVVNTYENDDASDMGDSEIKIVRADNTDTFIDPDAKSLFQEDWKYVVETFWMEANDIIENYELITEDDFDKDLKDRWRLLMSRVPSAIRDYIGMNGMSHKEMISNNGMLRVIRVWNRRKTMRKSWYNSYTDARVYSKAEVPKDTAYEWTEEKRKRTVWEVTTIIPYIQKLAEYTELDFEFCPFVVCVPMYVGGKICESVAWIEGMIGLQEELNKTRTAIADIAARQSNGATWLPPGEEAFAAELRKHGSEHGFVGVRETINAVVFPDEHISSNHTQTLEMNAADWGQVSGLPASAFGQTDSSSESGTLYAQKVRQGSVTVAPLFANFSRADKQLSMVLLETCARTMKKSQIKRILGEDYDEIEKKYPGSVDKFLSDFDVFKYDTIVVETDLSQSVRQQQLKDMQEIIKSLKSPELSELISLLWINLLPTDDTTADEDGLDFKVLMRNYIKMKYGNLMQNQLAPNPMDPGGGGGLPPNPQPMIQPMQPGAAAMTMNDQSQGGLPPNPASGFCQG